MTESCIKLAEDKTALEQEIMNAIKVFEKANPYLSVRDVHLLHDTPIGTRTSRVVEVCIDILLQS